MRTLWILTVALGTATVVTSAYSPAAFAGPHDAGYYVCNADNGVKYWRFVKKRSDAQETEFKQAVTRVAGIGKGCRSVSYPTTQPTGGTEI
jgi:hypothetical protein